MPPATIICIGMAGSGKTTFMQRLNSHLHSEKKPPYVINLDPAVLKVPYGVNIDIRDSVKYRKVMEQYNLGPNGAIMTSLNLFSTKIDQVIQLVEKRSSTLEHVLIDTPGQIECFIWSASGSIITESFSSTFPTVIAYIVDTPRSASPTTFISNMLYACSILYKTKLPMIIVFNKIDIKDASFAKEWMTDFEKFQDAISEDIKTNESNGADSGYMASLVNSMSLVLEQFYNHLDIVNVSSYTGEGFDEFLKVVHDKKINEYENEYKKDRDELIKKRKEKEEKKKQHELSKLMKDIGISDDKEKKEPVFADSISDTESIDSNASGEGLLERDEDEFGSDERRFDDRQEQLDTSDNLQQRYQQALKTNSTKNNSTGDETMEKVAKYLRDTN